MASLAATQGTASSRVCAPKRAQLMVGTAALRSVRGVGAPIRTGGLGPHVQPSARSLVMARGKGGLLDAPVKENVTAPSKSIQKKKAPVYKVLLHNDNYNRREYVVKVILKVVKGVGVDDAVKTMQEAHETGVGMVIMCAQEDAETYCEGLRLNGLTSSIEPGN